LKMKSKTMTFEDGKRKGKETIPRRERNAILIDGK